MLFTVLYTSKLVTPIIHCSGKSSGKSNEKDSFCLFILNSKVFCGLECVFSTISWLDFAILNKKILFNHRLQNLIDPFIRRKIV